MKTTQDTWTATHQLPYSHPEKKILWKQPLKKTHEWQGCPWSYDQKNMFFFKDLAHIAKQYVL